MSKLIALVATAVLVDGVRTVVEPGQELPGLNPHDRRELLQAGAAENPADTAAQAQAQANAAAAASAEFEAARQQVLESRQSTDPEKAAKAPAKK